jgi:hypothetical protein
MKLMPMKTHPGSQWTMDSLHITHPQVGRISTSSTTSSKRLDPSTMQLTRTIVSKKKPSFSTRPNDYINYTKNLTRIYHRQLDNSIKRNLTTYNEISA